MAEQVVLLKTSLYYTSPHVVWYGLLWRLIGPQCVFTRRLSRSRPRLLPLWNLPERQPQDTYGWSLSKSRTAFLRQHLRSELFMVELLLLKWEWKIAVDDKLKRRVRLFEENMLQVASTVLEKMSILPCCTFDLSYDIHFRCKNDSITIDVKNDNVVTALKYACCMAFFLLVMGAPTFCIYFNWKFLFRRFILLVCIIRCSYR